MRQPDRRHLGTRRVTRSDRMVIVTGPERTLVEGFRHLDRVGGLEELAMSASGFAVLDLDLMEAVLRQYDIRYLWAACGWFLEQFQRTFHVPNEYLSRMEQRRPASAQYVDRRERRGVLAKRWNVILPGDPNRLREPDDA